MDTATQKGLIISAWSIPPDLFADVVEDDIDNMVKGFALTCYRNIIMASPVDTGRFRASHIVSINEPYYTVTVAGSMMIDLSPEQLIANAQRALKGAGKGKLRSIYIQTNVPYAEALENGHSKQASAGIYGPAFNAAVVKYS